MGRTRTAAAVLMGALLLAGCGDRAGDESGDPARDQASALLDTAAEADPPTELTCPSGELVGMAGGQYAELPDGLDTPGQAVEAWLAGPGSRYDSGAGYVVTEDGTGAFVLREDGTAAARVDLLRHRGFTADGYEACTD